MIKFFYPLAIILLTSFSIAGYAQAPHIEWQKSYGGEDLDFCSQVIKTLDGGYVQVGTTYSDAGDIFGTLFYGICDIWVVKTDSIGTIEWNYCYGGSSTDQSPTIGQTTDSGYIIVGQTVSNNEMVSGNHGQTDFWAIKIDKTGTLVWQKCYGGSLQETQPRMQLTFDNGFIIAGSSSSVNGDVTYTHGGYWIVKVNDTGAIQWQRTYGSSTRGETAYSIVQTTDSGYMIAGFSRGSDGDLTFNHGLDDIWLLKIDRTGNIVWQHSYGGSGEERVSSVIQTADGGYVVAGQTASVDGDITFNHGGSSGITFGGDVWIFKTNDTGKIEWQKTYGGAANDGAAGIAKCLEGGYVFAATTFSHDGDVSEYRDSANYWIVKIDDTGKIIWNKVLGGSSTDAPTCIFQEADSSLVIDGSSRSINGNATINKGESDFWLVKLGWKVPLSVSEPQIVPKIYPTVTDGSINIILPMNVIDAKISVHDFMGRSIRFSRTPGTHAILKLDDSASPGLYSLHIQYGDAGYVSKIVLVR